jgi:protein-tyrosine-phosphatase
MKKHILFLCTGNLCRSPLAEGILKHKLEERGIGSITVSSAGTFGLDGRPAAELAVEVAAERGIDISAHRARQITREMLAGADIVLCAETDHIMEAETILRDTEDKYRLLSDFGRPEKRGQDIEDPYGGPKELYMTAYERIEQCVEGLLTSLL